MGWGERFLVPQDGLARFRVEGIHFDDADCSCIVVAEHTLQVGELGDAFNTFIRVGTVTHQVAQAPDGIEWSGVGEHGFEGEQVGMDVGDDQGSHGLMLA